MSEFSVLENVTLPLVSIVIPAYNHGKYLEQSIESVLSQSYPRVELIVLDDGSADNTVDVLTSYGNRFHWETQMNMGQSATLTKGWAMANGDLLGYLSADDVLYPNAIAEAVSLLTRLSSVVMVYPDFDLIDEKSGRLKTIKTPEYQQTELVLDLVCQAGPGALFRRDAYRQAGPWDTTLRQNPDLDFWLRLSIYGDFARLPQNLAGFRVHVGSTTYNPSNFQRAEEPANICRSFLARTDLPEWILRERRRVLATGHLASAQLHLKAGRFRCGMSHVAAAFGKSPSSVLSTRSAQLLGSAMRSFAARQITMRLSKSD